MWDDGRAALSKFSGGASALTRGKQALLLSDFRGDPIKACPGTPNYICCGYEILNFGSGCALDCAYCALQSYFSNPLMVVQANSEAFLSAAAQQIRANPDHFYRLGTGEFTDSLALDSLTGYASKLVEFVKQFPNAALELKSKACNVDALLQLDHGNKTTCSWSVNSEEIVEREEFRVASLKERLDAAAKCQKAGYKVAFHFDPIFYYKGWESGYRDAVARIFEAVPARSVAWISMGCFRFAPGLDDAIRERFPKSKIIYDEFVRGGDGKMRYPQPLRILIYRKMMQWIRAAGGPDVLVYLCMENRPVWESAMGVCPRDDNELKRWLDAKSIL